MELALQANGMPEERLGHQRSPRQAHCHLPEVVAQRPALIRISKFHAHVAPGGLGGFARPGPLRTIPGPLEHGHPLPGSHWPRLLPLRGDRSKLALWDRVSGRPPCSPSWLSPWRPARLSHRVAAGLLRGAPCAPCISQRGQLRPKLRALHLLKARQIFDAP